MIAVLKHELRSAFHSLTIYLFCAALLCFVGVGAMIYNIQASVANFEYDIMVPLSRPNFKKLS